MIVGSGKCQCGAVTFQCTAEPLTVTVCYCRDCQKSSGSAFGQFVLVPAESITIRSGQMTNYWSKGESGRPMKRQFCSVCGSPLFASTENVFGIAVGCLDDARGAKPEMAIWVHSAQPWAPIPERVECFQGNPPISSGM